MIRSPLTQRHMATPALCNCVFNYNIIFPYHLTNVEKSTYLFVANISIFAGGVWGNVCTASVTTDQVESGGMSTQKTSSTRCQNSCMQTMLYWLYTVHYVYSRIQGYLRDRANFPCPPASEREGCQSPSLEVVCTAILHCTVTEPMTAMECVQCVQ